MLLNRVIGVSLKAARVRRGLTLRDVSSRASVALGYLSEIERGDKEPSSPVIESILSALGLDLESLLRDCLWRVSESITDPFQDPWWDIKPVEAKHELEPV